MFTVPRVTIIVCIKAIKRCHCGEACPRELNSPTNMRSAGSVGVDVDAKNENAEHLSLLIEYIF